MGRSRCYGFFWAEKMLPIRPWSYPWCITCVLWSERTRFADTPCIERRVCMKQITHVFCGKIYHKNNNKTRTNIVITINKSINVYARARIKSQVTVYTATAVGPQIRRIRMARSDHDWTVSGLFRLVAKKSKRSWIQPENLLYSYETILLYIIIRNACSPEISKANCVLLPKCNTRINRVDFFSVNPTKNLHLTNCVPVFKSSITVNFYVPKYLTVSIYYVPLWLCVFRVFEEWA